MLEYFTHLPGDCGPHGPGDGVVIDVGVLHLLLIKHTTLRQLSDKLRRHPKINTDSIADALINVYVQAVGILHLHGGDHLVNLELAVRVLDDERATSALACEAIDVVDKFIFLLAAFKLARVCDNVASLESVLLHGQVKDADLGLGLCLVQDWVKGCLRILSLLWSPIKDLALVVEYPAGGFDLVFDDTRIRIENRIAADLHLAGDVFVRVILPVRTVFYFREVSIRVR